MSDGAGEALTVCLQAKPPTIAATAGSGDAFIQFWRQGCTAAMISPSEFSSKREIASDPRPGGLAALMGLGHTPCGAAKDDGKSKRDWRMGPDWGPLIFCSVSSGSGFNLGTAAALDWRCCLRIGETPVQQTIQANV
jgi:hypothetical protein